MSSHPYPARRGREVIAVGGWEYRDRRPAKDGQPYPIQNEELKGGSRGKPDDWLGETSSGLRSRQSGIGYGLSGTGAGPEPEPVPGAELLNLGPDGRDLGPEKRVLAVSGWRLEIQRGGRRALRCPAPTLRPPCGGRGFAAVHHASSSPTRREASRQPQGFSFNFSSWDPGRPSRHSPTLRRLRSVPS